MKRYKKKKKKIVKYNRTTLDFDERYNFYGHLGGLTMAGHLSSKPQPIYRKTLSYLLKDDVLLVMRAYFLKNIKTLEFSEYLTYELINK